LLSPAKQKIHERIFLRPGRLPGDPTAAFFLYDKKDRHLDNDSGHLYEYIAHGAKLLHSSGKYNNVYSGTDLRGGGVGEESLDLLLVMHQRHQFPIHPDRKGDERDFMRRGSIKNLAAFSRAENNDAEDSFGQYAFQDYYGPGSRWIRRSVLTREGILVVADHYVGGEGLGEDYVAGPVWHLAVSEKSGESSDAIKIVEQKENWFDAPAFAHAWWQGEKVRVLLRIHQDGPLKFGRVRQRHSQDSDPNITCFAWRPITRGKEARFLSVFLPYLSGENPSALSAAIKTEVTPSGEWIAQLRGIKIRIEKDGQWSVVRAD
jgi:hypothetical protein